MAINRNSESGDILDEKARFENADNGVRVRRDDSCKHYYTERKTIAEVTRHWILNK
jgi:hypothetical protein